MGGKCLYSDAAYTLSGDFSQAEPVWPLLFTATLGLPRLHHRDDRCQASWPFLVHSVHQRLGHALIPNHKHLEDLKVFHLSSEPFSQTCKKKRTVSHSSSPLLTKEGKTSSHKQSVQQKCQRAWRRLIQTQCFILCMLSHTVMWLCSATYLISLMR